MKKSKKDCNIQQIKEIFAAGQYYAIDLYKRGYSADNPLEHCLNSMGSMCLGFMQDVTEKAVLLQMGRKNRSKRTAQ
jgi:hypothetical protein